MIRIARAKLKRLHNLQGFGQTEALEVPGMYVADGCLVVPGDPGAVLPLDLVGPMVPAAAPAVPEEPKSAAAPVPAAPARRRDRKAE